MALGSGLGVTLGTVEESAYGTPVTVDRWYEIVSESLERRNQILQSDGLGGSSAIRPRRGSRRVLSAQDGGGTIDMEIATTGFGRWFKHMLWDGTPTVSQQATTSAYLHTYDMGDLAGSQAFPVALTIQKGVPQVDGTARPFTFHGSVVTGWTISVDVDSIARLSVDIDAEDVDTSTGLETATYGSTTLFTFRQGTLTIDAATAASVLSAEIFTNYNLKTDRYYLGSSGLKAKPTHNDWPEVGGTLTADFTDLTTFHNRFTADTAAALVLEFEGSAIEGAYNDTLTITLPEVRFTGETPKVGGPETVVQNVGFEGAWDGTSSGVIIEYQTTDTQS